MKRVLARPSSGLPATFSPFSRGEGEMWRSPAPATPDFDLPTKKPAPKDAGLLIHGWEDQNFTPMPTFTTCWSNSALIGPMFLSP